MNSRIGAVVLAAGGSSRLGEPKQLLTYANGETLVHRSVRDAIDAGATPVIVVVGAHAAPVRQSVQDFIESSYDVTVIENVDWNNGLSSSIECGVNALMGMNAGVTGVLLLTCDMPSVSLSHLQKLRDAFNAIAVRVASAYGNTRGIPAIIAEEEFAQLTKLSGDKGAKSLFEQSGTVVVELIGGAFDLDTRHDVAKWRAQEAMNTQLPIAGE
ncbi:MAG: nucleotidyltransferase family protein [Gemmatimonadaceae bacterium]